MTNYLPQGYKLNSPRGEYTIEAVIGRGATAVAYIASFDSGNGLISKRILKECYPSYITINRTESGALLCETRHESKFSEIKNQFAESGATQNNIRNVPGLTNLIPPILDRIYANNTVYLDVMNFDGETWDNKKDLSLIEKMRICLSVAKAVKRIHESNHLCLDLKPSNVLVLDTTSANDDVVHFIDFDSIRKKTDIGFGNSLSFTEMWAAPEQSNPYGYSSISEATDIYTIGELVFWSVFGRHSKPNEHRAFSVYPFDEAGSVDSELNRKSIRDILTELFRNTLRSSVRNRYQTVSSVIDGLEKLVSELNQKEYLVCHPISQNELFVGRDDEIKEIAEVLKHHKTVYVCGIGGIGKTTLVRNYCTNNEKQYDAILFLRYAESLISTFADDNQVQIHSMSMGDGESPKEYFDRKLRCLNRLYANSRLLIVLDNYDGQIDSDFKLVINGNWQTIIVTRQAPASNSMPIVYVDSVKNKECLYQLFEANLGRKILDTEHGFVDTIFERVANHTLIIELIAKQVMNSRLSIEKAAELVSEHGFAHMAVEKVDIVKDQDAFYATISDIITAVFDATRLSREKTSVLKLLSLFKCVGVSEDIIQELFGFDSKDTFNELHREGWLIIEELNIKLHPVISETVGIWEWADELQEMLLDVFKKLFKYLKLEEEKEEYPKKLSRLNSKMKEVYEKNPRLLKFMKKVFVGNDYVKEAAFERMLRGESYKPADQDQLQKYVDVATALIEGCQNLGNIKHTAIYKDLLFRTIISTPRYKDEYILEKSMELLNDDDCSNGVAILKLYDLVVSIYCERYDFSNAWAIISNAEHFVKHQRDKHLHALYYDLISTYYDGKLNGSYDAAADDEEKMLSLLLNALDQSIRYMKKSNHYDRHLWLSRFYLSKANVLIRSCPEKKDEIDEILTAAKRLLEENTLPYSELRCDYNMSRAWYYTLVEPYYKGMIEFAQEAYKIGKETFKTGLDLIEKYIVPLANMLLEWKLYDESAKWLSMGVRACEEEADVIPYIRKRMELLSYMLDVYIEAENKDKCRELVSQIDELNAQNKEYGIKIDISEELRNYIQ